MKTQIIYLTFQLLPLLLAGQHNLFTGHTTGKLPHSFPLSIHPSLAGEDSLIRMQGYAHRYTSELFSFYPSEYTLQGAADWYAPALQGGVGIAASYSIPGNQTASLASVNFIYALRKRKEQRLIPSLELGLHWYHRHVERLYEMDVLPGLPQPDIKTDDKLAPFFGAGVLWKRKKWDAAVSLRNFHPFHPDFQFIETPVPLTYVVYLGRNNSSGLTKNHWKYGLRLIGHLYRKEDKRATSYQSRFPELTYYVTLDRALNSFGLSATSHFYYLTLIPPYSSYFLIKEMTGYYQNKITDRFAVSVSMTIRRPDSYLFFNPSGLLITETIPAVGITWLMDKSRRFTPRQQTGEVLPN